MHNIKIEINTSGMFSTSPTVSFFDANLHFFVHNCITHNRHSFVFFSRMSFIVFFCYIFRENPLHYD